MEGERERGREGEREREKEEEVSPLPFPHLPTLRSLIFPDVFPTRVVRMFLAGVVLSSGSGLR